MKMQFITPTSRQFPFDESVSLIVEALRLRNFDVPGITVKMSDYGSGEQWVRHVGEIVGDDFALRLHRHQGDLPGGAWGNATACSTVVVGGQRLDVYSDESGPRFYLYVGDNWTADRSSFIGPFPGVNSKLYGEPRRYLMYRGTTYQKRSPTLVHTNDLGQEYDPTPCDPVAFSTADVMAEIDAYLRGVVLPRIEAHPIADTLEDPCAPEPVIPWPEHIGPLFCYGTGRDRYRVQTGQQCPDELPLHERYGLEIGDRLMWLDVPNDGTVPCVAYDGFVWCGIGDGERVPGQWHGHRDAVRFAVTPNRANHVYVADHAAYERRRAELSEEIARDAEKRREPVPTRFTDEQVADMKRARGRTIVTVTEYRGDYEQPIVLVGRELGLDEIAVCEADHG